MRTRLLVASVVLLLAGYFVLLGRRGWLLLTAGGPELVALGVAVLILPLLGAGLVLAELRFGRLTELMDRQLREEGGCADFSELPARPSGRPRREALEPLFEHYAQRARGSADWRPWFRMAQYYDAASDRKQARAAMRAAITRFRSAQAGC